MRKIRGRSERSWCSPAFICGRVLRSLLVCAGITSLLVWQPTLAQSSRDPEAVSGLGRLLVAKANSAETEAEVRQLEGARRAVETATDSRMIDALLDLGAALDQLWRYREAVSVYSRALSRSPDNGVLFRRRGIASMRLRNLDRAFDDLRRAVRLLPEDFESRYRLGLVQFLRADFRRAARTMEEAEARASNDRERLAALYWGYASNRRADRRNDADFVLSRVPGLVGELEGDDYAVLLRMIRGVVGESSVYDQDAPPQERSSTRGFGVANWHLWTDGETRARDLLEQVAQSEDWPAIGVLAAEVELDRLR